MWVWLYGISMEQVEAMIKAFDVSSDMIVGTTIVNSGDSLLCGGIEIALSAAKQGKFDTLIIPTLRLLGRDTAEQFQSYGIQIKNWYNTIYRHREEAKQIDCSTCELKAQNECLRKENERLNYEQEVTFLLLGIILVL